MAAAIKRATTAIAKMNRECDGVDSVDVFKVPQFSSPFSSSDGEFATNCREQGWAASTPGRLRYHF
jgi:hypothetical protein